MADDTDQQPDSEGDPFWQDYEGLASPNYTMVPNDVLDDLLPRLSQSQFAVVICLCRLSFGWQQHSATASLTDLAARTGLHRRSIMRAVRDLEELGVISVLREPRSPTSSEVNIYALRVMSGAQEHALWLKRNKPPHQAPLEFFPPDDDDDDPR